MDLPTRPVRTVVDAKRETVMFHYPNDKPYPQEFYMRGGISWPRPDPRQNNELMGFVVMLGQHIETGRIMVFESRQFVCVDPVTDVDEKGIQQIKWPGVGAFFMDVWRTYFALTYYYNQPMPTHRLFHRLVLESPMIQPDPILPSVHWDDLTEPEAILARLRAQSKLVRWEDELLDIEINKHDPLMQRPSPAMHALFCALWGMTRTPWRPPPEAPYSEEWV